MCRSPLCALDDEAPSVKISTSLVIAGRGVTGIIATRSFAKIAARFGVILMVSSIPTSSASIATEIAGMYIRAVVSTAFFASLSMLITLGSKDGAVAEIACIAQPTRDAPQGEHWYYHFDREKNQKCWHHAPVVAVTHESPLPPRTERAHSHSA